MPYYEELTVRENLTLAAQMRLSSNFGMEKKFKRVEQVMYEVGCSVLKYLLCIPYCLKLRPVLYKHRVSISDLGITHYNIIKHIV